MADSWPSLEQLSVKHTSLQRMFDEYADFSFDLFYHTCHYPQSNASSSYVVSLMSKLNMIINTLKDNVPQEFMERQITPQVVPAPAGSFEDPIPISSSESEAFSTDTEEATDRLTEYDTSMDEDDDESTDSLPGPHNYPPSLIPTCSSSSDGGSDLFGNHKHDIISQRQGSLKREVSTNFQDLENLYREAHQRGNGTINDFADDIDFLRKYRRDYQSPEHFPKSFDDSHYGIHEADAGSLSFDANRSNTLGSHVFRRDNPLAWGPYTRLHPWYYYYANKRSMNPQSQHATLTSPMEDASSTMTAGQESRTAQPVATQRGRNLKRLPACDDSVQTPQVSKRRRVG
ncbi:hypothetical protein N7478_004533 [Penicillium angulare]|uniref:uncharacterized protein n=1 Tax=Penicillium angulare TaxID=116970 RepID=UPI00254212EB|nr:uncharacterized protein N7478_004533 [Penicillium angulare]KAJ5279161.1 hypothetical protein N7478_004533 [Penicillium angulare]